MAQEPVERKVGPFRNLVVGDKIIVRLVQSDHESASIRVQGIDAGAVKTASEGDKLTISIYGEPFTKKKVMITLHYVAIRSITVTGGAEVTTAGIFKTDSLEVDLKSGGMLYLDADVKYLAGKIIEGALLNAEGYANEQQMVVSTSGTLSALALESEKITIRVTTGGKAKIHAEEELHAEAASKGFISYKGDPEKFSPVTSSGGTIVAYEP
jgi:hypothetical protein